MGYVLIDSYFRDSRVCDHSDAWMLGWGSWSKARLHHHTEQAEAYATGHEEQHHGPGRIFTRKEVFHFKEPGHFSMFSR